jgi:hypothetical protein
MLAGLLTRVLQGCEGVTCIQRGVYGAEGLFPPAFHQHFLPRPPVSNRYLCQMRKCINGFHASEIFIINN